LFAQPAASDPPNWPTRLSRTRCDCCATPIGLRATPSLSLFQTRPLAHRLRIRGDALRAGLSRQCSDSGRCDLPCDTQSRRVTARHVSARTAHRRHYANTLWTARQGPTRASFDSFPLCKTNSRRDSRITTLRAQCTAAARAPQAAAQRQRRAS